MSGDVENHKQRSIAFCDEVLIVLKNLLTSIQTVHYTLRTMRGDYLYSVELEVGIKVKESMRSLLTKIVAAQRIFNQTKTVLLVKQKVLAPDHDRVCILWNDIRPSLESQKSETILKVYDFLRYELNRIALFGGAISGFANWAWESRDEEGDNPKIHEDNRFMQAELKSYFFLLNRLSIITSLFLRYSPEMIDLYRFYCAADGLYMYFPELMFAVIHLGHIDDNFGSENLLEFAVIMCKMGYIGPPSHLKYTQYKTTPIDTDMFAHKMRSIFELKDDICQESSYDLLDEARDGISVNFFSRYRLLQLYVIIMEDIIAFIKGLYIWLKRSTCYFMDKVFPEMMLMEKLELLMTNRESGVNIAFVFTHLQEILFHCKEQMKVIRGEWSDGPVDTEAIQSTLIFLNENVILAVNDTLLINTWRTRNLAISKLVIGHYRDVAEVLYQQAYRFAEKFVAYVLSLGIKPQELGEGYTRYKKLIYIYLGMREELKSAIQDTKTMVKKLATGDISEETNLVVLDCTTTAATVLQLVIDTAFPEVIAIDPEIHVDAETVMSVVNHLLLPDRFRQSLVENCEGLRYITRNPMVITPAPRGPSPYFDREDINMNTAPLPEVDVLTARELNYLLTLQMHDSTHTFNLSEMNGSSA